MAMSRDPLQRLSPLLNSEPASPPSGAPQRRGVVPAWSCRHAHRQPGRSFAPAVEALATANFIYCEDTRRTLKLLSHASIKGPRLVSTIVSTRPPARPWPSSA